MQVISSTEFAAHRQKYFHLARQQQVLVRDGDYILKIISEPTVKEQTILQPDEDLRRAITAEELVKGIHEDISRKFAARK